MEYPLFHEFDEFLVKMQTLDDSITDFTPPVYIRLFQNYNRQLLTDERNPSSALAQ